MPSLDWRATLGLALLATAVVSADTLVLRDGRRIEGELVSVRDGSIEFEEAGRRRVVRFDRDEVRSISLDDGSVDDGRRGAAPVGRPRGLREREIIVSADLPFVDTGIDLRPGQDVYFEAVGNVWWKKGKKDGPAGERNSPYNPGRPMPRRPAAALIGSIGGDAKDLFFIGSDPGPMQVPAGGRLFLGVNDDHIPDNRGNFRVVVFY